MHTAPTSGSHGATRRRRALRAFLLGAAWALSGCSRPLLHVSNGGDRGVPISIDRDGALKGLDAGDAIATFETPDGTLLVLPSNRVTIRLVGLGDATLLGGHGVGRTRSGSEIGLVRRPSGLAQARTGTAAGETHASAGRGALRSGTGIERNTAGAGTTENAASAGAATLASARGTAAQKAGAGSTENAASAGAATLASARGTAAQQAGVGQSAIQVGASLAGSLSGLSRSSEEEASGTGAATSNTGLASRKSGGGTQSAGQGGGSGQRQESSGLAATQNPRSVANVSGGRGAGETRTGGGRSADRGGFGTGRSTSGSELSLLRRGGGISHIGRPIGEDGAQSPTGIGTQARFRKTASASTLGPDGVIWWRLVFVNSGDEPLKRVELVDCLPHSLRVMQTVVGSSAPTRQGNRLTWQLGTVGPRQHRLVEFATGLRVFDPAVSPNRSALLNTSEVR